MMLLATMAVAAALGCRPDEAATNGPPADQASDQGSADAAQADVIDRLRSLPYVNFSRDQADDERDGVIHHDPDRSYPGYNLYTARWVCRTDLIDEAGRVIQSWQRPGLYWEHAQLTPQGDLLVVGVDAPPTPDQELVDDLRYLLRLSWDDRVVWKRRLWVHHDVAVAPGGQFLSLGVDYRHVPDIHADIQMRDDQIMLLSATGRVEETCSLYDTLSGQPELFQFQKVGPYRRWSRRMVDLFHANSVQWMPHPELADRHPLYATDNVLVCFRHQDTVAIINWTDKKLVWAWGQGELSGPHDASFLPNGHILLFDNGLGRGWSRIVELDPLTRKIVWQYTADPPTDFYTRGQGGNQRLPNGNTLITDSDSGRAFEVTTDGEIVWEFLTPYRDAKGHRAAIVRVDRYERDYVRRILTRTDEADRAGRE